MDYQIINGIFNKSELSTGLEIKIFPGVGTSITTGLVGILNLNINIISSRDIDTFYSSGEAFCYVEIRSESGLTTYAQIASLYRLKKDSDSFDVNSSFSYFTKIMLKPEQEVYLRVPLGVVLGDKDEFLSYTVTGCIIDNGGPII